MTLDRTLTYKNHCEKTQKKVNTRNGIIRKLVGLKWVADPDTLRISAMALCFSTAEYACPVWRNSVHTRKMDIAINEAGRIIIGCLKPTKKENLYMLSGIAPPCIRRDVATDIEKDKNAS